MMDYKLITNQEIPAVVKKRLVLHWVVLAGIYPSSGMKQFCCSQYWLIHCKKVMDDVESPFGAWGGWWEEWPGSEDQMSLVQRKGWRKNPIANLKYVRNYMEKGNNLCAKVECKFRLAIRTTFLRLRVAKHSNRLLEEGLASPSLHPLRGCWCHIYQKWQRQNGSRRQTGWSHNIPPGHLSPTSKKEYEGRTKQSNKLLKKGKGIRNRTLSMKSSNGKWAKGKVP